MSTDYSYPIKEGLVIKCQKKGYDGKVYLFDPMRILLPDVMRWLREKHLLHVYAEYKCFCDGQKQNPKPYFYWMPFIKPLPGNKFQTLQNKVYYELDDFCDSHEKACVKAVEYAVDNLL